MNSKHNNRKNMLSIVFLLAIMLIIPFSSSLSEDIKPDKIKINHNIKDNKNVYENEYISITSDLDNTIDLSQAILNDKYISIPKYDKKKSSSNYELKFYTGNDGVAYDIYKSDLTDVSKKKVKETGFLYAHAVSKDNYVTIKTTGFSSLVLSIPNIEIPFQNTIRLNMDMYFNDCDSYDVTYYNPVNTTYETLSYNNEKIINFYYDLKTYTDSFNSRVLEIRQYEKICYLNNCTNFGDNNDITIDCIKDSVSGASDTFKFYTLQDSTLWDIYKLFPYGLQDDLVDYYDFNQNENHADQSTPFAYSRFNLASQYNNFPSSWASSYGIIDGAFDFDGSTDYVDNNIAAFTSANIASVSLWFKTSVSQQSISLFGSNNAGYTDVRVIDLRNDPLIRVQRVDGTTDHLTYAVDYTDNNWHHVVYTEDATNGAKLYFDGVLRDSTTYKDFSNNIEPYIGARNDNGATIAHFDGYIDEVATFDKELSLSEVQYLYNGGDSRNFYNLKNPYPLTGTFCFSNDVLDCGTKVYYGELQERNVLYLDNLFNAQPYTPEPIGYRLYSYNITFWNYDLAQEQTITHGESYTGPYFDLTLYTNDTFVFDYHTAPTTKQNFDLKVKAISDLTGLSSTLSSNKIYLHTLIVNNVTEIKPFSIEWNTPTGLDLNTKNISLLMGEFYSDFTDMKVTYSDYNSLFNDSIIYTIDLEVNTSGAKVCNYGNISVCLDPTIQIGNINLEIYSSNLSKTYNSNFEINMSNSVSSLTTNLNIISGEVLEIVDLKKATISNQSVVYNEMVCVDTDDYFYNVSKVSVLFEYENVSYNQTQLYNFGLVGPPTAITNETTGFIAYTTELAVFCFEAKEINLSQYITMIVYDNLSNSAQQNFYINVVASIPMTEAQTYLANFGSLISGLFPDASSLSTLESLSIVIGVILIVSILILVMTFKQFGVTSIYITLGVDILLFLLFAGLNYISTGFLVLIALLLIGLSYLKIRSS